MVARLRLSARGLRRTVQELRHAVALGAPNVRVANLGGEEFKEEEACAVACGVYEWEAQLGLDFGLNPPDTFPVAYLG